MSSASEQAHDYAAPRSPLPPPPPPPPPPALASPRPPVPGQTSPLRRIAVQPPIITTALAPLPQQQGASPYLHQTPLSAPGLSVPPSPYAPSFPTHASPIPSSPMAMRSTPTVPYNPQQWGRNGPTGGAYVPHSNSATPTATGRPREVTGMEATMPSPPPPYSPGQTQNLSQAVGSSPQLPAQSYTPPPSQPSSAHPEYVPSAQPRPVSQFFHSRPGSMVIPSSAASVTSNPQFPPPPPRNSKDRSLSRDKGHGKFSLSAFRNRQGDHSPAPSAIESLRINTSEALSRAPASPGPRATQMFISNAMPERRWSPESPVRPPAGRRAASTGTVGLPGESSRTPIENSPTPPQASWGPGMPLPPPPPGLPPSSSRSQSLGRATEIQAQTQVQTQTQTHRHTMLAPPTRRPGQSILTPIPPTPLGWQDEQVRLRSRSPAAHGLHIDTGTDSVCAPLQIENEDVSVASGPTSSTVHSTSTLYRAPGKREPSSRGIRERRSESRAARERSEPNNNPWAQDMEAASAMPADLNLSSPGDGSLARRGAVTKGTPRSGGVRSPRSGKALEEPGSSDSTPRLDTHRRVTSGAFAPTPPFSPGTDTLDHHSARKVPIAIPAKALPTPPLHQYSDDHAPGLTDPPENANRSISQTSRHSDTKVEPSSSSTPTQPPGDPFALAAVERHRQFIEKESSAQTDQARLELFADFIVAESRLRRDRYSAAFDSMAGDIMDLTRDLWRSYGSTGRRSVTPSAQAAPTPSGRRSQASIGESPDTRFTNSVPTTAASPASSVANFTPHTEPASPASATSQRGQAGTWNSNYQPVLSPIPSMAMSTVPDEEDSRGRSASRWWEASGDGASSGRGGRKVERSKRESKYMGIPKEAIENLQWEAQESPAPSATSQVYGPNEYPQEKVGLHDEPGTASSRQSLHLYPSSAPATPDPHKLDVSRLVTLPPPYPRHHPAVNNNHPDLASIRSNLRALSDLEEVKATKGRFKSKADARHEREKTSSADRRAQLRYNVQENVRNSLMTYAEAAQAEADFESREHKRAQDMVQSDFDTFQTEVANPLHALFCERITKVSASIEHLKGRLSHDAQELNPNQTQEEGDEQPELLEMLTLLKWLFDTREQLHKEMFELEDERNDLYKDIIILPYIQTKNEQKVKEATAFFRRDAQDRKVTSEKEILKRYEAFMNVIEENVTRGVEAQLSAFWDIAPGLLAVVQKVPPRLEGFDILIPPQEYDENPAYHNFPLQYLYSLLAHAGRSAYQFIESQINLLCLLHEIKTGVMTAGSRLLETQRIVEGEEQSTVDVEMRAIRQDEEARLTDDLKDKVGLVESQWGEALGMGLEECKSRVEKFLVQRSGWDECLKE